MNTRKGKYWVRMSKQAWQKKVWKKSKRMCSRKKEVQREWATGKKWYEWMKGIKKECNQENEQER